jgi:hypothetical protein
MRLAPVSCLRVLQRWRRPGCRRMNSRFRAASGAGRRPAGTSGPKRPPAITVSPRASARAPNVVSSSAAQMSHSRLAKCGAAARRTVDKKNEPERGAPGRRPGGTRGMKRAKRTDFPSRPREGYCTVPRFPGFGAASGAGRRLAGTSECNAESRLGAVPAAPPRAAARGSGGDLRVAIKHGRLGKAAGWPYSGVVQPKARSTASTGGSPRHAATMVPSGEIT